MEQPYLKGHQTIKLAGASSWMAGGGDQEEGGGVHCQGQQRGATKQPENTSGSLYSLLKAKPPTELCQVNTPSHLQDSTTHEAIGHSNTSNTSTGACTKT